MCGTESSLVIWLMITDILVMHLKATFPILSLQMSANLFKSPELSGYTRLSAACDTIDHILLNRLENDVDSGIAL